MVQIVILFKALQLYLDHIHQNNLKKSIIMNSSLIFVNVLKDDSEYGNTYSLGLEQLLPICKQ